MSSNHDLVIIGGGSAAFAAAITASELGARVAMVESDVLGGTCVNIGCVPSKAMLRAAEQHHEAKHPRFGGVETTAGRPRLDVMVAGKDELVADMRRHRYEELVDVYGFEVVSGHGRFTGTGTVEVEGRQLEAGRFLVATGASPWVPPVEGLAQVGYLTSTTALELERLPSHVLVVGANAVGLELGQLYLHLGAAVTFVEVLPRIAPSEEPEISEILAAHLEALGARILTETALTRAGETVGRAWLEVDRRGDRLRLEAEALLVATGRRARTAGLGLPAAGVEVDARGHIQVDGTMATSNPAVYAAGDVATLPQYVYVAAQSGRIAAENALLGRGRRLDLATVPRVTFTDPAIASVGMTEAEAAAGGKEPMVSTLALDLVPRALVDRTTRGVVKLVAETETRRLLGAHVLARGAGDVIQAAVMGMRYGARVDEIADAFHPYLTMAEALKLAAQGFGRDVHHLSCCA